MHLQDIQKDLALICQQNKWDTHSVAEVFLLFSEEIGELAKEIRKHQNLAGEKKPKNSKNLEYEFADVFNYLLELANRFDINLTDAYYSKRKINENRTWK